MSDGPPDEAFAHHVNELGIATLEQLDQAKSLQAENAKKGVLIPLAQILVHQGVLTPAMRDNVEKKLKAMQAGGLKELGNYKLIKKLGEGGMGAVYLADDTIAQRKVAIKVLPRKYAADPEFLTRFRREAKAAGKLNHVNIIGAFTVGEELGNHFYVMEYCDGQPLDSMLKGEQVLAWDRAIGIIMQVARGLKHAHDHGFIHRDIKPANIFMTHDGVAKILDLGLSKNIMDSEQSFNTQTGVAMGTPHYISPEQARGDKGVDGRTDIYSLGATLYHLVTGQTPFQGTTAAMIMMKHLSEQLPNPQDLRDDIPDAVVHVIQKMMAKEPVDRYANCAELLEDLDLVIEGKSPSSHALDAMKSSIAMRGAKRNAAEDAAARMRRRTGSQPPVASRKGELADNRKEDRRATGRRAEDVGEPLKANKTPLFIGAGIAALGALVLVVAMTSGSGSGRGDGEKNQPIVTGPKDAQKTIPVPEPAPAPKNATKEYDKTDNVVKTNFTPEELALKAIADARKWQPLFTGESLDGFNAPGLAWRLENKAIVNRDQKGVVELRDLPKGITGDCDFRIRFDVNNASNFEINARNGRYTASFDRLNMMMVLGKTNDLILSLKEGGVSGTLNGAPLMFKMQVRPASGGVFNFYQNGGGTLRIQSVEYSDPAVAVTTKPPSVENRLVFEDFEKLDLAKLPKGWFAVLPADLSLVEQPDHGKVLRIDHKGPETAELLVRLETANVAGRTVRYSALVKCPKGSGPRPPGDNSGPKLLLRYHETTTDKQRFFEARLTPGNTGWQLISGETLIPQNCRDVMLGIRVQAVTEEIYVDEFSAVLVPQPADGRPANVPRDATEFQGRWYKVMEPKSWAGAKEACEIAGGHLVTITSAEENAFLLSLLPEGLGGLWTGLHSRDGQKWEWATGEALTGYSNWAPGEPNGNGTAGQLLRNGKWNDNTATAFSKFVCEWEPAKSDKVLVSESFDNFDLKNRPPGSSMFSHADFSLVPEGNGQALRVNTPGGDKRYTSLQYTLPIEKVRGRAIRVAVRVKCPVGYKPHPTTTWAKPNVMVISTRNGNDARTAEYLPATPTPDWKPLVHVKTIPADADQVRVGLFVELIAADVYFDDFTVDVDPGESSSLPGKAATKVDEPARWANATKLVPSADVQQDAVQGKWERNESALLSPQSDIGNKCKIELPYQVPDEYDLRTELSIVPGGGGSDVTLILSKSGTGFGFKFWGRDEDTISGFENVGGQNILANSVAKRLPKQQPGKRYELIVEVRKNSLKGYVDGALVSEWKPVDGELSMWPGWKLRSDDKIGLGSAGARVLFHSADIVDVTGTGKLLRAPAAPPINLLALVDTARDSKNGTWQIRDGALVSDAAGFARTELPYQPAEEYDFRIEFTAHGNPDVNQLLTRNGQTFHWMPAGAANTVSGFAMINGQFMNETTVRKNPNLQSSRRYESLVQVRKDGLKAFIDGKLVSELKTNFQNLSPLPQARMTDTAALGVLSHNCPTTFHKIEVIEVTGKGKFTRPK